MRGSDRINFPWKLHRSGDCFWKMSRSVNEDVVNEEMWMKDSRPCGFTEQAELDKSLIPERSQGHAWCAMAAVLLSIIGSRSYQ